MPRATQTRAAQVVNFFRTTELGAAEMVLDLAKDAMRERQQRSKAAKVRVATTRPVAAAQARAKKKTATATP